MAFKLQGMNTNIYLGTQDPLVIHKVHTIETISLLHWHLPIHNSFCTYITILDVIGAADLGVTPMAGHK